jgi:hypothetical protein
MLVKLIPMSWRRKKGNLCNKVLCKNNHFKKEADTWSISVVILPPSSSSFTSGSSPRIVRASSAAVSFSKQI